MADKQEILKFVLCVTSFAERRDLVVQES